MYVIIFGGEYILSFKNFLKGNFLYGFSNFYDGKWNEKLVLSFVN